MGAPASQSPLLLLLAAAASAVTLQGQPQALVAGYGKEFRPFGDYNGIPIAQRISPWTRAAEIQSADTMVYPGQQQVFPGQPSAPEQQPRPADGFISQRMGPPIPQGPYSSDQGPQTYEHSMLLIDHPGDVMPQQQQSEQRTIFSTNSDEAEPQTYVHSMLLIDHPSPAGQTIRQQRQPEQQTIVRNDDSAAVQRLRQVHSMLEIDHPVEEMPQQDDQQAAMSDDAVPEERPAEETVQEQQPSGDQQSAAQESSDAAGQVTQQDNAMPQGPGFLPYQGPRPFGIAPQPQVALFQSNEPYPGLSPPPAYQPPQMAPWGVQPIQMPIYPVPFRDGPRQQDEPQAATPFVDSARPAFYPDLSGISLKGDYAPPGYERRGYGMPPVGYSMRVGMVPRPPGGVAPFLMPSSVGYAPEPPLEGTRQAEDVPDDKNEQSESDEAKRSKADDVADDDDESSDDIENKVKALKDAADVEEEVVPALVVFLRKKGHKAFHDKDSVGIPGKEDRFRRSPGGGSGSSSHSSSSSSSSSGPLYFGDGGGSYSSSSSQSSSSSSSGGGAPLVFGASGPGLGGGSGYHGGAGNVPPSGYGGYGGGGNYANPNYGNNGHGNGGGGNYDGGYGGGVGGGAPPSGGGGGYGGGGYGGGGGGYGGGCATCGGDGNVLLNRFGELDEGAGGVTLGGSGTSKGQGVHSSASSSIDSTGKVTYTAFAGKH